MSTDTARIPPPPPPPPRDIPTEPDSSGVTTFSTLKSLGYPVEFLSPWQLVSALLQDLLKERNENQELSESLTKSESDKRSLVIELAKHVNELTEEEKSDERKGTTISSKKADAAKSRTIAELSARNARLEADLARTRKSLSECQAECQRLASVASFATQVKEAQSSELETEQRAQSDSQKLIETISRALEEEKGKCRSLEDEVDRLKVELVKQDGIRETLQHKLDRSAESLRLLEESKKAVEETLARSREETKTANELLLEERRSKKLMKAKMDEIAKELESSRTELTSQERIRTSLEKNKLELEQQNGILKRQVSAQGEALANRDEELRQATTKLETVQRTLEEERKAHNARLHEIRAAAQDVANMTRENRELGRALERQTKELREVKSALEESRAKHSRLAGMLDAAKLERSELVATLRRLNEDKQRMSEDLKALADARADLVREERHASDEVVELTKKVVDLENVVRRQQMDLDTAEKRAEGLGRELRLARSKIESLEEGMTIAERASGNEQQKYMHAARMHDSIRAELEQTRSELGICVGRLERAMEENARLSEDLVSERIKSEQLEAQLEQARIGQAKALISSGQAFASTSEKLRLGTPSAGATTPFVQGTSDRSAPATTTGGVKGATTSSKEGEETSPSSSASTTREDFDAQFEELERVMGDDLSEASSVIRQVREDRQRRGTTPAGRRLSPSFTPHSTTTPGGPFTDTSTPR